MRAAAQAAQRSLACLAFARNALARLALALACLALACLAFICHAFARLIALAGSADLIGRVLAGTQTGTDHGTAQPTAAAGYRLPGGGVSIRRQAQADRA